MLFFFAALAEVQVTFLSVLNLPRQGLPLVQLGTVVFAARGYLPQKYFAIRQRTKAAGRVAWKPKMHDDVHLASLLFVYGLLLGNCGYQTDRKIYDQSEIAARLRSSRNPHAARATKLYTRFARINIYPTISLLHRI